MESMRFSLQSVSPFRIGCLKFDAVDLATPATLLYTQAGSVPHLTVDNVNRLTNFPHPLLSSLQTTYSMRDSVAAVGAGLCRFCGFPERRPMVQVLQDPLTETQTGYNNRNGVCVFDTSGKIQLSPESLTEVTATFRPSAFQALTDGDTPQGCSNKRLDHAVKRSARYLEQCLQAKADQALPAALLASVQGGFSETSRKFSISGILEQRDQENVSGFIVDGFHTNGPKTSDLQFSSFAKLLQPILEALPKTKPRFMFGCFSPDLIIQLARAGIDCFDSSYACLQTENRRALVFSYTEVRDAVEHKRFLQLDDAQEYKEDFSTILENCSCYTCSEGFSRAYINHLLQTKELLASILLQMHNLHHWLRFFEHLRVDLASSS